MEQREVIWRLLLENALHKKGMSMKAASIAAGLGETTLRDALKRNRSMTIDNFIAVAETLEVSPGDLLVEASRSIEYQAKRQLSVIGSSQAGAWLEFEEEEFVGQYIPVEETSEFFSCRQYALLVKGTSINKIIPENDYALCVDFADLGREAKHNDVVVVQRTRGQDGIRETTIKQVVFDLEPENGSHISLWPRSTDPKHQTPIELGALEDDTSVSIVSLVWGRFGKIDAPVVF